MLANCERTDFDGTNRHGDKVRLHANTPRCQRTLVPSGFPRRTHPWAGCPCPLAGRRPRRGRRRSAPLDPRLTQSRGWLSDQLVPDQTPRRRRETSAAARDPAGAHGSVRTEGKWVAQKPACRAVELAAHLNPRPERVIGLGSTQLVAGPDVGNVARYHRWTVCTARQSSPCGLRLAREFCQGRGCRVSSHRELALR